MSNYSIFISDENLDICVGYDEGFHGYWMFIQDHRRSTAEKDFFLFNNIDDVPGVRMCLALVEESLAKFGIGLPRELAEALVKDGNGDNYLTFAREEGFDGEAQAHEEFIRRIRDPHWAALAPLPVDWS